MCNILGEICVHSILGEICACYILCEICLCYALGEICVMWLRYCRRVACTVRSDLCSR